MQVKTKLAKASRPALLRSLDFNEESLNCILSIMKLKSSFLALPLMMEKPRYFSRELVLQIEVIEVMASTFLLGIQRR